VERDNDFFSFMSMPKELVTFNRPIRLNLDLPGGTNDDMLLPQRVFGTETLCGGIEYRILCVSSNATLPLKQLIAVPAALQFVTDQGDLRSVCGIVTEASSGDSDGGLASYQLVLRDALAILEKRINTRVFRQMDEVEIVRQILLEWRQKSSTLGVCFMDEVDEAFHLQEYPKREFTMQHNESDAAFIRRLLKRSGIGWYVRAETSGEVPTHTLVLFNSADSLRQNVAGTIRYHRDAGTEQRDTITSWGAVRSLQPGVVTRHSWDYRYSQGPDYMMAQASSGVDQGVCGNELAASLDDYQVMVPHAGDDVDDLCRLGKLHMSRHDFESKCFHGEGSVRDLCAGEYFTLSGHPEVDRHPREERDFVVTALQVNAQNNLPKALAERVERLFSRSRWTQGAQEPQTQKEVADRMASGALRMHVQFTAVRRGVKIVPAYDARTDLPQALMQSAIVVGPKGEEVCCDQMGRVKIRFPGTRTADHKHAEGSGASNDDSDSAWVRVASNWAGNGPGSVDQCGTIGLPRVGTEVLVNFLGGDPDKPVIVGQLYNQQAQPPALSNLDDLPANRYLSGIKSREIKGVRSNQLRLDDTTGEISAQLKSDHGRSELNLGFLTLPREHGAGALRGEGAELRSDDAVAIRGAEGLLLTAWKRLGGEDKQLARDEFLMLLDQCVDLAHSLGEYAENHQALPTHTDEQTALRDAFNSWDTKTAQKGAPAVAITSPAGISFATPKACVTYAGTSLDMFAQKHLHLGAGKQLVINSRKGMSLYAQDDGLRAIAHRGPLLLQSQHGSTTINASTNITFTATEGKLVGMAKEIVLISEDGSYIKIGGGINLGTSNKIISHGSAFDFVGPQTLKPDLPNFTESHSEEKRALHIEMFDADGDAPNSEPLSIVSHSDASKHTAISTQGVCSVENLPSGGFTIFQTKRRK
jgi:type VI secretion system secreted protein VgrG